MTTILLARHGETDWNADGRFQGHADVALNELGRQQARALGLRLRGEPIDAIWSSDLGRAKQTAFYVASSFGLPVRLSGELREMDVGRWSGHTREEIAAKWPEEYLRWRETGRGWPDGEDFDAMQARTVDALHGIAAAHEGQLVLVVTHGGPIRAVQAHAAHMTLPEHRQLRGVVGNCEVVRFEVAGGIITALDDDEPLTSDVRAAAPPPSDPLAPPADDAVQHPDAAL